MAESPGLLAARREHGVGYAGPVEEVQDQAGSPAQHRRLLTAPSCEDEQIAIGEVLGVPSAHRLTFVHGHHLAPRARPEQGRLVEQAPGTAGLPPTRELGRSRRVRVEQVRSDPDGPRILIGDLRGKGQDAVRMSAQVLDAFQRVGTTVRAYPPEGG